MVFRILKKRQNVKRGDTKNWSLGDSEWDKEKTS